MSIKRFLISRLGLQFILIALVMASVAWSDLALGESSVGSTRLRVPVIVRTINLWENHKKKPTPYYAKRMAIIAQLVHRDGLSVGQKYSPGLIGLQEVKVGMKACQAKALQGRKPNGGKCFAALLAERYKGHSVNSTIRTIVYGDDFRRISRAKFEDIGPGRELSDPFGGSFDRTLYEALLEHKASGLRVRFYNIHLYPGKKRKNIRKVQAQDLIRKIRNRAKDGELPPILVGDFNYVKGDDEPAYQIIDEYFQVAGRDGIDVVYIGRESRFPKAKGRITANSRLRNLPLADKKYVYRGVQLSDHNSGGSVGVP